MSLTALQIRAFSPGAAAYKRADERGLYLEIFPNGSKLWRLKYYVGGKEKRIALGAWPEVSLQAARLERDELRLRIAKGEDPALTRKAAFNMDKWTLWGCFLRATARQLRGSVAAQRKGVDPFRYVGGAPANAAAADVDGMGEAPLAHLPPDGGAAADSGEAQHLLAGDQFGIRHDKFLLVQGSVTGAVVPFRSAG